MDNRALEAMGWLQFEPAIPVRQNILGEVVYNEHWQALMRRELVDHPDYFSNTPNAMLADILRGLPHGINQREATVATTLIVWLGTACGQGFINSGRRYAERLGCSLEQGYYHAWAAQNVRASWVNHGYRLIELLLAPAHSPMRRPRGSFQPELPFACASTVPQLTTVDHEVCEHVAAWLGTPLGQAFVTEAEREIELRRFARPAAPRREEVAA
jgi:hypothetical protein